MIWGIALAAFVVLGSLYVQGHPQWCYTFLLEWGLESWKGPKHHLQPSETVITKALGRTQNIGGSHRGDADSVFKTISFP